MRRKKFERFVAHGKDDGTLQFRPVSVVADAAGLGNEEENRFLLATNLPTTKADGNHRTRALGHSGA